VECPVYWRDELNAESKLEGPMLIGEISSTILVPPACQVEIDRFGNVIIEIGG
jgi:N-methylhydantoinase A